MRAEPPFPQSFFIGGFECSTHRRRDRKRLDLTSGTRHDEFVRQDYARLARHGLRTVRDGLRWHLIEASPGDYDWSSWLPMLRAAQAAGVQVVWDIWHYGTPDFIDIWSSEFVERLTAFATAAAELYRDEVGSAPIWCPLNELSFYAFIAGEVGDFHPYALERGFELKRQLAIAAVKVSDALRAVDPRARLLWAEPVIDIQPATFAPEDVADAAAFNLAQYQAWDMISGRLEPQVGGRPDLLDIVGVNFYPHNQRVLGAGLVPFGHHAFRPFADILAQVYARYGRPMIVAETGAEGSARAPWLHYIGQEVDTARAGGVPVEGVCLYPVISYPGWDDDRHCATGLFGPVHDDSGGRPVYQPLLEELERQSARRRAAAPREAQEPPAALDYAEASGRRRR